MKQENEKAGTEKLNVTQIDAKILKEVISFISVNKLSTAQVKKIFSKKICEQVLARGRDIPISIFNNDKLSVLEAVVKYLKEIQGLKLIEIALMLNRNSKTIWTTYNNASKKMSEPIDIKDVNIYLPVKSFQDRAISPLEVVVRYLKDELGFKNHEIATMLNRNQKTIWTTYNRKNNKK